MCGCTHALSLLEVLVCCAADQVADLLILASSAGALYFWFPAPALSVPEDLRRLGIGTAVSNLIALALD